MSTYRLDGIQMPDGNDFEIPIFTVEYGVTTYEEVAEAFNAGKFLVCNYNDLQYLFWHEDTEEGGFGFISISGGNVYSGIFVNPESQWSNNGGTGYLYTIPVLDKAISSTDKLCIVDRYSQIKRATLQFGSSPTKYLANDGTWQDNSFFGVCSTGGTTAAKTVTISGFTSACLVDGARVSVHFVNKHTRGAPTLNVSSTGAKAIQTVSGTGADSGVWGDGQIVSFVYYNGAWVIEDGAYAAAGVYGKVKLVSSVGDYSTAAPTSEAVYRYVTRNVPLYIGECTLMKQDVEATELIEITTPATGWEVVDNTAYYSISYDDEEVNDELNANSNIRLGRLVFDDEILNYIIYFGDDYSLYVSETVGDYYVSISSGTATISCPANLAGVHTLKVEVVGSPTGGIILTQPLLEEYLDDQGYLTSYTETDPTVPSWAKQQNKPSYTASEVGAIASPSSPSNGQYLKYNGSAWAADNGPSVPSPSSATPQALGTAAAGSSSDYSRADHVHAKPTAADIGAIASPSSPSTGDFLVWNGTAWAAQSLSTWQGGNY